MEKLTRQTPDLTARNVERIKELFPSVVTEGRDDAGEVVERIDFDLLRQELSDHVVDGPSERYQLDWPGKRAAARLANTPIAKTLRPVREESVDFDSTQNIFIEGDNLDVLKLLQESYLGKVKLIYIDPPYNTGHDFIYNDDFAETTAEYLERTGQTDEDGGRLVANTESNGRFHSDWLSMMYPRLKLARNLLADDGLLMVSIGESELASLYQLCNEIFGSATFAAIAPRKTGAGSAATRSASNLRKLCDFVLIQRRSQATEFRRKVVGEKEFPFEDQHGEYLLASFQASGSDATRAARPNMWYPLYVLPNGDLQATIPQGVAPDKTIYPSRVDGEDGRWLWNREKFIRDHESLIEFDGTRVWRKVYRDPDADQTVFQVEKAWFDGYRNAAGSTRVAELFGHKKLFDHPKPVDLVSHLIDLHPSSEGIILDFFGGSGTTAEAVIALNAEDGGTRQHITVQLGEVPDESSPAAKAGYASIAALARERIRRAGAKIKEEAGLAGVDLDVGFRAFQVDSTNRTDVRLGPDETEQLDLESAVLGIKQGRSAEDLLFQILLEYGLELSLPIVSEEIGDCTIFDVDSGSLIFCKMRDDMLNNTCRKPGSQEARKPGLTSVVEAVAAREPLRVVFVDSDFVDDAERINVEQMFRERSPQTEVRVL